jgi:DNA polymerase-4
MKERIVIHVDVNNAFLSWTAVEMLKNGSKVDIRKRYAVIGGDEKERRGVVTAKSYPCKSKGVVTGESIYSARRKCPYLEVYKGDFKVFREYSDKMYNYLCNYSNIIERYSIDECFIEYTDSYKLFGNPIEVAYKIKEDIKRLFGFTVNVGVGNNKLCAKMASDFKKPDMVHTLFSYEVKDKIWNMDVSELFMIGKSSSKRLHELNIKTIGELANTNVEFLNKYFKSMGRTMWEYANGIDNSPVYYEVSDPKSISTSTVLPYNYRDIEEISKVFKELSMETGKRLRSKGLFARGVSIWIKYSDFSKFSKQKVLDNTISNDEDIYNYAMELFRKLWNRDKTIRGLCVGVSYLSEKNDVQLSIFSSNNEKKKENDKLQKVLDDIRDKYGSNIINYADMVKKKGE